MSVRWEQLLTIAESEVKSILSTLPEDLSAEARRIPVLFETVPGEALLADGIEADTLGLFVGDSFADLGAGSAPMPPQIFLFLQNLWEAADSEEEVFRKELRTTFLHELGHYLGLDEADLEERGLD